LPAPSPTTAPKVGVGEVIEKEVKQRALPPIPTDQWDKDPNQEKWKNERAPVAIAKVKASVKGTELEQVLKGRDIKFEPRKVLERGAYGYQDQNNLVCGMAWIKDAEADPRNVWPNIAHELGGHREYGSTYASKIMDLAINKLPEAERKKWKDPKVANQLFDAFAYAETEIFAALRERRYAVPEKGAPPTYGGMRPDDNIEARLRTIEQGFPKEVGLAILIELKAKIQASPEILQRDKNYFLDAAKKHGYLL
jgi:hypothetical protein